MTRISHLLIVILAALPTALFSASITFNSTYLHYNNYDLQNFNQQKYVENKASDSLNTDDRGNAAFGELEFRFDARYKKTEFFIEASRAAWFGSDQFQGADDAQNPIIIKRLYFTYYPVPELAFAFGRQRYQIGDAETDYFFFDTIDALKAEYIVNEQVTVQAMGDVLATATRDTIGIYGVVGQGNEDQNVEDFQGDTITWRGGLNVRAEIAKELGLRFFTYYLQYGANGDGGADLAEDGRNDLNRADGDFMWMSGVRTFHNLGNLGEADFTAAYTLGRDFMLDETRKYNGVAAAANYTMPFRIDKLRNKLTFSGGWFHKDFASMKGRSMGGLMLFALRVYYPSPYTNYYSVRDEGKRSDSPEDVDKTNSKTFASLKYQLRTGNLTTEFFGLGLFQSDGFKYMGSEANIVLKYRLDNIELQALSGIFIPSNYYIEEGVNNTFIPQGSDPMYAVALGVRYVLDLSYIESAETEKKDEIKDSTDELLEDEQEFAD